MKNILYLVKAKNQSYFLESYYFCLQLLSQYIVIHHSIIEEAKDYLKVNCKFIFHPLKLGNLISAIFSFIISKMAYFLKATAYNFINPIYNFILIFLLNKFGFQDVNYSDSNEIIQFKDLNLIINGFFDRFFVLSCLYKFFCFKVYILIIHLIKF